MTEDVLKCPTFNFFKFLVLLNIKVIFTTLWVSKLDISKDSKFIKPFIIEDIEMTEEVSKFDKFKLIISSQL